jgi:surfactin synthase thioesterase subunit
MRPSAASSVLYWCVEPRPMASARLVCFPYAGAGASAFRLWAAGLPNTIEVLAAQLPGREGRFREPPARDWKSLVGEAVQGLQPHLGLPYALFGHSMGAALVLAITREIERRSVQQPRHLFVSGWPAPGREARWTRAARSLQDEDFLGELARRYGSLNGTLLDEPEVRDVVLPTLRADIEVLEGSAQGPQDPVSCPLTVYGGTADPSTTPEDLQAWQDTTSGPFRIKLIPGGHFFLNDRREELLLDIGWTLASRQAGRAAKAEGASW